MLTRSMEVADADVVKGLCRPGALGGGAVELRTTHASWVFLRGDDVWKVKRPVALGFLDFRTLEARRRFCEEEVRLNGRLAPQIYLGVEPVRRSARGLTVGARAPGDVVDWAVHMKRLPDDASAAARLARGTLDAEDLGALAETLAVFHRACREAPSLAGEAALRANVEQNFGETEAFVGELLDRDTFDEARAFQLGWLSAHGDLVRARQREGRIREGHGDLRLEHVYLMRDAEGRPRPVVIDCLEFDERFRCGDVAADVSFLAMELEAERRPELAAGFLARYAEASDDFGLFAVVDFYLSYRAWIRGKVAALVAADAASSPEARRAKRLEARRDFALARSCAGRALDPGFVVAVGGVIGAGKSTLASALGRALAVPVVSSDRTRKAVAGLSPTARGDAALYTEARRDAIYGQVLRRAEAVVRAGRGVVLDATFAEPRWRAAAGAVARAGGVPFVFIEVTFADEEALKARLRARRASPSTSDATDLELEGFRRRYVPPAESEGAPLLHVDGGGPEERTLASALAGLRALLK
jgi:aminoglycoside phosphotransferase family enzyme/predicted kinase